jgi:predicted ferric reductase
MTLSSSLSLIALIALCFQPVLAARIKWLDRMLGLDVVYIIHKTMGIMAGTVAALWPITLAVSRNDWGLLLGIGSPLPICFMDAGAILAIIIVLTALLYRQMGFGYETWRTIHNVLALLILILVFTSGMFDSGGTESEIIKFLRAFFLLIAVSAYAYHKILGPWQRQKHPFIVTEIKRENHNVWTLKLSPPEGYPGLSHIPGQFQFLTFYRERGLPQEEHPFTIASSGVDELHSSTIKESGDFTSTIGKTKIGDAIAVQAPFGRFSYVFHPDEQNIVFIAGGIGITPFISMLRHMRITKAVKKVLLLYANNNEQDIVFRDELDEVANGEKPQLTVIHVLSKPDMAWKGERGFINKELIESSINGEVKDWAFYVCGPPPMMTAIIGLIASLGVSPAHIHSERFAL